jgi:hypothetical protein
MLKFRRLLDGSEGAAEASPTSPPTDALTTRERINELYLYYTCNFLVQSHLASLSSLIEQLANLQKFDVRFYRSCRLEISVAIKNFELMISRGFLTLVAGSDKQQILCLAPSHEQWRRIDPLIDYAYINQHEVLEAQMKTFLHITAMTNCICFQTSGMEDGPKLVIF